MYRFQPATPIALEHITTPAYVADIAALKRNIAKAQQVKQATGCKILLATKAFSMFSVFPVFASALDGTTASGYYEARLGHEHFQGEVHAYCPAFTAEAIEALLPICGHVYFNSLAQLRTYAPLVRANHGDNAVIGLRLNPQLSLVKNSELYDPSSCNSRFGVLADALTSDVLAEIDLLHVHNLCENMAEDSVTLIEHLMRVVPHALDAVRFLNLGGGHYLTHPDYHRDALIKAICTVQQRHNLQVILEPGGALAYDAGYLVATVVDILYDRTPNIAILDTSATCHMPDILEVPYRPNVIGDTATGAHRYLFTGNTCMSGDIIGEYAFEQPLKAGDKLVFTDMMQYSMVKNTSFNGVPLPDIGILHEDGRYECIKRFGYADFAHKLS